MNVSVRFARFGTRSARYKIAVLSKPRETPPRDSRIIYLARVSSYLYTVNACVLFLAVEKNASTGGGDVDGDDGGGDKTRGSQVQKFSRL